MVAINRKRIRCIVVAVPAEASFLAERGALAHDLVPGADPYVAQLIRRLQDEVREERLTAQLRQQRFSRHMRFEAHTPSSDLDIPWFDVPLDDEPLGEENVPELGTEN